MAKALITILAALLIAALAWVVVGFIAAIYLTSLPRGGFEGVGAMTGVFVVGPIAAVIAFLGALILLPRYLDSPGARRAATAMIVIAVMLLALIFAALLN